ASCASACIFVIRGCMFLLSLTATCQVCTVSLKAGQSTYKGFAGDGCQRPLVPRSRFPPRLTPSVGRTSLAASVIRRGKMTRPLIGLAALLILIAILGSAVWSFFPGRERWDVDFVVGVTAFSIGVVTFFGV